METTYGYDNADRLLNITHKAGATTLENLVYEYDANGARTRFTRNAAQPVRGDSASPTCGTTDYTFNVRGQLNGISGFDGQCNPLTASFKYDALGRRVEKTINGVTTQYVYDGLDIIQEKQNGVVTADYVRTMNIDEPLARFTPNSSRFYKQDALGSVIALTDEAGVVKTTYTYDPFGNTTASGELSDNPFQYTGRENDQPVVGGVEGGLYYYRARYYSPALQRFISEDPIGLAGGDVNFYAYVKNRPTMFIDPMGLEGCGPGFLGDYIIPDSPFGFNFGVSCNRHDACYGSVGAAEGKNKRDCDREFYQNNMDVCSNETNPYWRAFCEGIAYNYYSKVRDYGQGAFNRARQPEKPLPSMDMFICP